MADEDIVKTVLDLDNEEFVHKLKESLGLLGEFGDGKNLEGLIAGLEKIGVITGVVASALLAVKTAVDLVVEAEHLQQVDNSFKMIAESAGIASEVLKNGLVEAAGGLVTEVQLLEAANKGIIQMGANAEKLPKIMEIARKYTASFGGELIQNFERLNMALANGNQRMLRHMGIVIDSDKAQKDFAKSMGIGVEFLSEAGKKQAVFNKAMEVAEQKFKDIDTSGLKTTAALKQITVAMEEIKEAAAIAWNALAGPTVTKMIQDVAASMHGLSLAIKETFSKGEEKEKAHKERLEHGNKLLRERIELEKTIDPGNAARLEGILRKQEQELEKINAQEEKRQQLELHRAQAEGKHEEKKDDTKKFQDLDKLQKERMAWNEKMNQAEKASLAEAEKIETDKAKFAQIRDQQTVIAAMEANHKILELKKEGLDKGLISEDQYAHAVENIQKKMHADIQLIQNKAHTDEVTRLKNLEKQNELTATGFKNAWQRAGAEANANLSNFAKLGETSFNAVEKHAVKAFQSIGKGSKDAGQIMKSFMFGALGDIATSQGEYLLASGIGMLAGGSPGGAVQIAEGGALIALGAALSSLGEGGGSAPSADSGGGGGGGGSTDVGGSLDSSPTPQSTQHKSVTIAIHGNIFETEQTRSRIVDMVRAASDATDFEFKKIGSS